MILPDHKELKKFITLCRKLGVKHAKFGNDFEFTLTDEAPPVKGSKSIKNKIPDANFTTTDEYKQMDTLTDEQLLFYSVANTDEEQKPMIGT